MLAQVVIRLGFNEDAGDTGSHDALYSVCCCSGGNEIEAANTLRLAVILASLLRLL